MSKGVAVTTIDESGTFVIWDEFREEIVYFNFSGTCADKDTTTVLEYWKCESSLGGVYDPFLPCISPAATCDPDPIHYGGLAYYRFEDSDEDRVNTRNWYRIYNHVGGQECSHPFGGTFYAQGITGCGSRFIHNCSTVPSFPPQSCGDDWSGGDKSCGIYSAWPTSFKVDNVSISMNGVGLVVSYEQWDGIICDGGPNTVETTPQSASIDNFEEDYAVASWPHYENFAILKEAEDREGTVHSNLLALLDNEGAIHAGSEGFQGTQFYFAQVKWEKTFDAATGIPLEG